MYTDRYRNREKALFVFFISKPYILKPCHEKRGHMKKNSMITLPRFRELGYKYMYSQIKEARRWLPLIISSHWYFVCLKETYALFVLTSNASVLMPCSKKGDIWKKILRSHLERRKSYPASHVLSFRELGYRYT